jgi:hypothetical protein
LSAGDTDGTSPWAKLKGTPKVVAGGIVPLAVLAFPPYSKTYSKGPSSVTLGSSDSQSQGSGHTISWNSGASASVSFPLIPLVSASISGNIGRSHALSTGFSTSSSVGQSFSLTAAPETDGPDSGAVIIACSCFQQFDYDLDDPAHITGTPGDGKTMSVHIPVGGQASVWSTRRYNALADALKTLPKINLPYKLGDLQSYPTQPARLDGTPIPPDDMVFTEHPTFRTSDSANVGFSLNTSDSKTNSTSMSTSYGVSGSVGVGSFGIGAGVSVNVGKSIDDSSSISISEGTTFAGGIQPIRNDPNTAEDEFALHGYSFSPFVYRQRYTDANQKEFGFYVLMYAVGH